MLQIQPVVLVCGTEGEPKQLFLGEEQLLFMEIFEAMNCPGTLLALYKAFNTSFPPSLKTFYGCLELELHVSGKMTPSFTGG